MTNLTRRDCLRLFGLSAALVLAEATAEPASAASSEGNADALGESFAHPPPAARPWVYWFWLDGNVSKVGITADLEAMARVGIGGVLIMCVDQGTPPGPAVFGGPLWNEMFLFSCQEAACLGLEVNMTNDGGWCGSGGPWVTPELSMQALTWSAATVHGDAPVDQTLPPPEARLGFYRDIAVLAFPTPASGSDGKPVAVPDFRQRADYDAANDQPAPAEGPVLPVNQTIPAQSVRDLSAQMDADGRLRWNAPSGDWTILRIGHTSTGVDNHPAPAGGLGLETDKLSARATEAHYHALMGRLAALVGPLAGKTLISTHIDSWETGSQNWTPGFAEDFQRLRGYDLRPYLPAMAGYVVESLEVSERFLWDVRQTVSDLLLTHYAGRMRELAAADGLRLSIEAYDGCPCDQMLYAAEAVEPMSEMWSWPAFSGATDGIGGWSTEMASAAHVTGKPIVGMETFTADSNEKWQGHPRIVKHIGDYAFCMGINRFVFHRYAMQPWLHVAPGVSMGPWGLHYERTQTWWEMAKPWHEYVARCQHLLREGQFVADVCYVQAEGAPRSLQLPASVAIAGQPALRPGYNFDVCPARIVMDRMTVEDGHLVLPGAMRYRALVLPDSDTMTPELLRKIAQLADAGAIIIGPRPAKSPSLRGFPECDAQVARTASALWGSGKIIEGKTAAQVLAARGLPPDFESDPPLNYMHRQTADGDIYFVANINEVPIQADCTFRVAGKIPELWDPETGMTKTAAAWESAEDRTRVPIRLDESGSVFVVFRRSAARADPLVHVSHNGRGLLAPPNATEIHVLQATYGPPGDPTRTRDVTRIVQQMVAAGQLSFVVADIARSGDPAYSVVKTLTVDYVIDGKKARSSAQDPQTFVFQASDPLLRPLELAVGARGETYALVSAAGAYQGVRASGRHVRWSCAQNARQYPLAGAWQVRFQKNRGAPPQITLDPLQSLSDHADPGVKYFSGIATYEGRFSMPKLPPGDWRIFLDLGSVEVMAQVRLNGRPFQTLWKSPYRLDVTDALNDSENLLQIYVANLWINRMIGDEHLPEDSERNSDGTLMRWPEWLLQGRPNPTGRISFTSWRLWGKTDPLVPSGLIGPVTLVAIPRVIIPADKTGRDNASRRRTSLRHA